MLRRCGIVEFKPIWAIVNAEVEVERLIQVPECGKIVQGREVAIVAKFQSAGKGSAPFLAR